MPKVPANGEPIDVRSPDHGGGAVSPFKKTAGYSISAASVVAAFAISVDRYAEFAAGAESFASWAIPPIALFAIAITALVAARLGHPDEGEADA